MAKGQQVAAQSQNRQQVARAWTQDEFQSTLDSRLPVLTPLLPAHVPVERFRSMIITEVAFNDKLWVCSLKSVIQAVRDAADLGLSLNKQMKEGDILPVWSPRGTEAQFRPRAIGLCKLARQSGEVSDIWSSVVYEKDTFHYALGLHKDLVHEPARDGQRGEMLQEAYCCWKAKDGSLGFEVIGAKRIARAKSASEGYKAFKAEKIKSTPWVEDEEEMIRKTAIIAATKYMPKSAESDKFMRAVALAHDSTFDDDDHVGAPSAPRVMPPRPTKESVKAEREAADRMREEAQENERRHGGRGPAEESEEQRDESEPEHDPETGEVYEAELDNSVFLAAATAIIEKINKSGSLKAMNNLVETTAKQQIEALPEEYRMLIEKAVVDKRAWFAK